MRALISSFAVCLVIGVGAKASATPGGTILYILDPSEQAELFNIDTTTPFARHDLRIAQVVDAAYAHDGTAIYVLRRPPGSQTVELIRMNTNGTHRQLVRTGLPNAGAFAVAPDGKDVALLTPQGAILIVKVGVFSKPRTLLSDVAGHWVTWSSDGKTLYYTGGSRTDTGGCWSGIADVCAFDLRTHRSHTVGPLPAHVHANVNQEDLSLSADGTRIAFSTVAGPAGIASINTDGRHFRRLVVNPNAFSPAWSPSGDSIAYRVNLRGLVVTDLRSNATRTIASFPGPDYPRIVGWNAH